MPAMWTRLQPDSERIGDCASQDCHRVPLYRFERGEIGSQFCLECAHKIAADNPDKLLSCPCCGGDAWFDAYPDRQERRTFYSVRCRGCDLRTAAVANPITPVEKWNRRPA